MIRNDLYERSRVILTWETTSNDVLHPQCDHAHSSRTEAPAWEYSSKILPKCELAC